MDNIRSIRVSNTKKIDVNDNGDYIEVPVDDANFYDKLLGIVDVINKITEEAENFKTDDFKEQIEFTKQKSKDVWNTIDDLFGDGSCLNIFGNIIPVPYVYLDFFEQLMPIVEEFMDDRQKNIAEKYKKRKGARTNKYRTKEELIRDAMR